MNFFKLPYSKEAFSGHLSKESFDYHYEKHHKAYFDKMVDKLDSLGWKDLSIEDVIVKSYSSDDFLFNNAAQYWNHCFFWNSISPEKNEVSSSFKAQVEKDFGSLESFLKEFKAAASALFGSGWAWIVFNKKADKLEILKTSNAANPLVMEGVVPICVVDVWEHAYYIDYRNDRVSYLDQVLSVLNWKFMSENYDSIKNNNGKAC